MARMAMRARMESQTRIPLIHLIRRIQVTERIQAPDRDSVMTHQDSARSLSTSSATLLMENSPARVVLACSTVICGAGTQILVLRTLQTSMRNWDLPHLNQHLSLLLLPSVESTMKCFIMRARQPERLLI